jgi:hypothetical protein
MFFEGQKITHLLAKFYAVPPSVVSQVFRDPTEVDETVCMGLAFFIRKNSLRKVIGVLRNVSVEWRDNHIPHAGIGHSSDQETVFFVRLQFACHLHEPILPVGCGRAGRFPWKRFLDGGWSEGVQLSVDDGPSFCGSPVFSPLPDTACCSYG